MTKRHTIVIPNTINKYFNRVQISENDFTTKWNLLKENIIKSEKIDINLSIINNSRDIKTYFNNFISINNVFNEVIGGSIYLKKSQTKALVKIDILEDN